MWNFFYLSQLVYRSAFLEGRLVDCKNKRLLHTDLGFLDCSLQRRNLRRRSRALWSAHKADRRLCKGLQLQLQLHRCHAMSGHTDRGTRLKSLRDRPTGLARGTALGDMCTYTCMDVVYIGGGGTHLQLKLPVLPIINSLPNLSDFHIQTDATARRLCDCAASSAFTPGMDWSHTFFFVYNAYKSVTPIIPPTISS